MTNLQVELLRAVKAKEVKGRLHVAGGFESTEFTFSNGKTVNTNTRRALVNKGLIKVTYLGNIKEAKHGNITATIEAV